MKIREVFVYLWEIKNQNISSLLLSNEIGKFLNKAGCIQKPEETLAWVLFPALPIPDGCCLDRSAYVFYRQPSDKGL